MPGSSDRKTTQAPRPRKPNYNQIHALPLPLEIYPLPVFLPHNPISILHVVWCSLVQLWSRPSSHPAQLYKAHLSGESNSIHVTDPVAIRVLWERGFFGKGSLSRSEPSWLERERRRQGLSAAQTSEEVTRKRREERKEFKKERARKEREMIEKQLLDEGRGKGVKVTVLDELEETQSSRTASQANGTLGEGNGVLPSSPSADGYSGTNVVDPEDMGVPNESTPNGSDSINLMDGNSSPGPEHAYLDSGEGQNQAKATKGSQKTPSPIQPSPTKSPTKSPEMIITNQEHLQLTSEEAFFLAYGLGVLEIWSDESPTPLPNLTLFQTFRQQSYFPPRPSTQLEMDDPFLLSYVVYHHFRSLGWVIRPGIKFGVDYLLYNRGPVFAHAEFAVVILPSYTDPYYSRSPEAQKGTDRRQRKPWHWLHCVNRVQSQVRKSLLLVYVEVPPPEIDHDGKNNPPEDIGRVLERYRVWEVNVKRWIPNRSRD
ncbi:MAG: hypothetical protein M1823_000802 [Watsoniomyces obsoletus]|nr:MAG: hypothetical protein M1823_000802 [Watsoniomyces obsoletus]